MLLTLDSQIGNIHASGGAGAYPGEKLAKILLVDSRTDTAAALSTLLGAHSYDITTTTTGRDALEQKKEQRFDLILISEHVSDIEGAELVEYLRSESHSTPLIFLTSASASPELLMKALHKGADSYLFEPVNEEVMLATVRTVLRTSAAEHEKRALISEIKRYSQRLQTIVENVPGIIWESGSGLDPRDHELEFTSSYFEDHLGYFPEDWQRKSQIWLDLIHPEDQALALRTMERVLETGKPTTVEFRIYAKDRQLISFETYLAPIIEENGRGPGLRGVSMDISERKWSENELRKAKEVAEGANRSKDQFISVLSHELRTPLTPVLTTIEMLETDPVFPGELRPLVDILRRNVELEARLIDDLLDLTKLSKGTIQLSLRQVNVHDIIGNVLSISNHEIRQKELDVRLSLFARDFYVMADPTRLQQVVWNLLHNAIKFTPAGGTLSLRTRTKVDASGNDAGALVIEVSDTGIGIEPSVLPHIFDAFDQGDTLLTRQFGGLGLGLSITKNLVGMHGGTISAQSAGRNLGSSFFVELPVIRPSFGAATRAPSEHNIREVRKRVLLVDDHADTSHVVQLLLERRGYEVRRAETVEAALALHYSYSYDILVSDIGLPDGNGYQLLEAIRKERPDVKAIALSGFGTSEDVAKSLQTGYAAHITKPFNFPDLQRKIEELLLAQ